MELLAYLSSPLPLIWGPMDRTEMAAELLSTFLWMRVRSRASTDVQVLIL
ncbi:Mannose glucose-specific lectin [Musa troglodytarum]|uniref:Mannose glucose-specific lectin n=1 Tax=Musa troglodytarum TaxID=320322 RepID=A0A9E7HIV1_9LILI|nr:Mannose glucose-specific lectin [Musa troglodytarum]